MAHQTTDPALVRSRQGKRLSSRDLAPAHRPDEFGGFLVHRSRRLPRKGGGDQGYEYEKA